VPSNSLPADFRRERRDGSRRSCILSCGDAGRSRARCDQRCDLDEDSIIDLFYETGGFSEIPEDEAFDFYSQFEE